MEARYTSAGIVEPLVLESQKVRRERAPPEELTEDERRVLELEERAARMVEAEAENEDFE
jgi:hypothetical protein